MRPSKIAILGYGRFGRALAELLQEAGIRVAAFDPRPVVPEPVLASTHEELVAGADVVIVAVPVAEVRAGLEALWPHLLPSMLVLDVASVKTGPMAALDEVLGARIPWAGTHPLFGPTSLALGERPLRVVVCPSPRHPSAAGRTRALFESIGCEVIEQTAEVHDRVMADTHALAFFVAKGLLDAGAGEGVPFSPPSFQAIARTIETVRSDAGHLFLAIQRENPFAPDARRRLIAALARVDEELRDERLALQPDAHLTIPDLGAGAPALRETRELIDQVDRELVELLARRAQLSRRAGRVKAREGRAVRDPERELQLLAERAAWAEARGLDGEAMREVFESILRYSRAIQHEDASEATRQGDPS